MNIVSGRGNNRKVVLEFPHASIVNSSPRKEQNMARDLLCKTLGVDPNSRPSKKKAA